MVNLGVLLPTRGLLLGSDVPTDATAILRMAEMVEAAALDSLWVGDSLVAKPRLEPLSTLAALAARTERVRLGTAVLLAALRHPVLLAQTIATVDVISQGRLVLGVGVGGAFNDDQRREWQAAGVTPARRAGRLEEILSIVRGLAASQAVDFHGRHFQLDGVSMEPTPVQPGGVPLLLATHGRLMNEAQISRAARLGDGLISISDTPDEYARLLERVRATAAHAGEETGRFETAFYMTVNLDQDESKAEAEANQFLMGYYGANIWGERWGPFGDPRRIAERMAEYVEAGAQTLVVRFASFEQERQLETFLDRVAPIIHSQLPPSLSAH